MNVQLAYQQQQKILDLMRGSYRLAQQAGDKFQYLDALESMMNFTLRPFCYAAFGEEGAGKTSLLAEFLGAHWETEDDVVSEGCCLWTHGVASTRWKKTHTGGMIERFIPLEILDSCEILDSGDSSLAQVQDQVEYVAPFADVIFLLFKESALDNSYTWEIGDKIAKLGRKNIYLVLTHCLYDEETTQTALAYLSETARMRWHYNVPVGAFHADSHDRERSLIKIRQSVDLMREGSLNRYLKQSEALTLVENLLHEVLIIVASKDRAMRHDGGFLQDLENEMDSMRVTEVSKVPSRCDAMGQIAFEFLPRIMKAAGRSMGMYPSFIKLFSYNSMPLRLESWAMDVLGKRLKARLESYDKEFLEQSRQHWLLLAPRAQHQVNCDIGEFPETELTRELTELRLHVNRMLAQPLAEFKLRQFLIHEFKQRYLWMRSLLISVLVLFCLGGGLGIVGLHSLALSICFLSFLIWLGGIAVLYMNRQRLRETAREKQASFSQIVRAGLHDVLLESALNSIVFYRNHLRGIHHKIMDSQNVLKPLQNKLNEVFIATKLLKREL